MAIYKTSDGKEFDSDGFEGHLAKIRADSHQEDLDSRSYGGNTKKYHVTYGKKALDALNEGNYQEAIDLYTDEINGTESEMQLANYYVNRGFAFNGLGNKEAAVSDWKKAADYGEGNNEEVLAIAQMKLGLAYHNGEGVTKNLDEFVKWTRKAAENGNVDAQSNMGNAYYNGLGVKQDISEAVKWWRKAAEQGNAKAQNNVGWAYENGNGVKQDYKEAAKWLQKAADQGHVGAKDALSKLKSEGKI